MIMKRRDFHAALLDTDIKDSVAEEIIN